MRAFLIGVMCVAASGCGGHPGTASRGPASAPTEPASSPAGLGIRGERTPGTLYGTSISSTPPSGSLSKEQIREVMGTSRPHVRACYERGLLKMPDLAGTVVVRFRIEPSGEVGWVTIASSSLGSPDVERCIAGVVKELVFPPPKGGGTVVVSYPYRLEVEPRQGPQ